MTTTTRHDHDHDVRTGLDAAASLSTVQGIPTLHAPGDGHETRAGLLFRVGRADETMATAGISHLVEHLALYRLGTTGLQYNGSTTNACTRFWVSGSEDEVATVLNSVCASLRDLPLERLETEKGILRTESSGGPRPDQQMPLWRYGAQGHGLSSCGELGTWSVTAEQVRDWSRTRFTRGNAVLYVVGDRVPEGLDLTLPEGTRVPMPAPTSALPVTPAYRYGDDGHVYLTSVVRRSAAAALFADVFERALYGDLRQTGGYSYIAQTDYSARDAGSAVLSAYCDALPGNQDAAVGAFIDTLARLRAGRAEQAELDRVRARTLHRLEAPDATAAALPNAALDLLLGAEVLPPAQARAEVNAVTLADLREVAREVWDSALFQVPNRGLEWAGCTLAPQRSATAVTGTVHPSVQDDGTAVVIGAEGVTQTTPEGPVTVRYDDCVLLSVHPDGGHVLTGRDGFTVTVHPATDQGLTPERLAVIAAGVPAEATIRPPAR